MTDLISEARALIADLNQSAQMPDMIKRLADALEAEQARNAYLTGTIRAAIEGLDRVRS